LEKNHTKVNRFRTLLDIIKKQNGKLNKKC